MRKSCAQPTLQLGRVDDAAIQRACREGGEILVPRRIEDERRSLILFMHDGGLPLQGGPAGVTGERVRRRFVLAIVFQALGRREIRRAARIAYRSFMSSLRIAAVEAPWGPVHVATTPRGVLAIAIMSPSEPFLADASRRSGLEPQPGSSGLLDRAVAAIEAFLAGEPHAFDGLPLDLADRRPWDRLVLDGVRQLQRGEVTSYGRLARMIGRPGAARAVGGAVGRNPIGLAIPCHRVIAGDGTIGGYGGDWFGSREQLLEIKRELLAREGVVLPTRLPD